MAADKNNLHVALARVEERVIALDEKFDTHHKITEWLSEGYIQNSKDIVRLKRDRWWALTIAGIMVTLVIAWVEHGHVPHHRLSVLPGSVDVSEH